MPKFPLCGPREQRRWIISQLQLSGFCTEWKFYNRFDFCYMGNPPISVRIHHLLSICCFLFFWGGGSEWPTRAVSGVLKNLWLNDAACCKTPLGTFVRLLLNFPDGLGNPERSQNAEWQWRYSLPPCLIEFHFLGPTPHRDFESSITSLSFNCFWLWSTSGGKLAAGQNSCVRRYSDTLSLC